MNGPPVVLRGSWLIAYQWWMVGLAPTATTPILVASIHEKTVPRIFLLMYAALLAAGGVAFWARSIDRICRLLTMTEAGIEQVRWSGPYRVAWEDVFRVDAHLPLLGEETWLFRTKQGRTVEIRTLGISSQDRRVLRETILRTLPGLVYRKEGWIRPRLVPMVEP